MTEEEAKKKACPLGRLTYYVALEKLPTNADCDDLCGCIGSNCMLWPKCKAAWDKMELQLTAVTYRCPSCNNEWTSYFREPIVCPSCQCDHAIVLGGKKEAT